MSNLNKILLFCVILGLSLEIILAEVPTENFEITFRRGELNEKIPQDKERKPRLLCLDENASYCTKYPLSKVNCKHDSSGFSCKSPDMPFLITFSVQSHTCHIKLDGNKKLYYPNTCYMRYSLITNWLLIVGFIVGTVLVVGIGSYAFIRIRRKN